MSKEGFGKENRLQKIYGEETVSFSYTNPATQQQENFSLRRNVLTPAVPIKDRADETVEITLLATLDEEGNSVFQNESAWVRDTSTRIVSVFSRQSYSMRDPLMKRMLGFFNEGEHAYRIIPGIGAATIVTAMEVLDIPVWYSGELRDLSVGQHSGKDLYTRIIPTYYGEKVMQDFDEREQRYRLRLRRQ